MHTMICAALCALPLNKLILFDSGFNILPDVFEIAVYLWNEHHDWKNVESYTCGL